MSTASGKNQGKGLTLAEVHKMFPDDKTAEQWLVKKRWPNRVTCPHCHSDNVHASEHPTMPYHCRPCRRRFSVRVGTLMAASRIGYRKWVLAIFRMTRLKDVPPMKRPRDLGITQRSDWHLAHRIRQTWEKGKEQADKRQRADRGTVGKTAGCRGEGSQFRRDGEDPATALAERQGKAATSSPLAGDLSELITWVETVAKQIQGESGGLAKRLGELEAGFRLLSQRVDAIEGPGKGHGRNEDAEREPV